MCSGIWTNPTTNQRIKRKIKQCHHSSDRSFKEQFAKRDTKPFNKKQTSCKFSQQTPNQRSWNGASPVTSVMTTPTSGRNRRPMRILDTNEPSEENVESNRKIKPKEKLLKSFCATTLNQYAIFLMDWFTDEPTKKERMKNSSPSNVKYTKQPRPEENFDISALADIIRNCNLFLADLKLQCCWNTL